MNVQTPPVDAGRVVAAASARAGNYRWVICGLLFAATAINYVDRQILGVLKPTLQHELGWNELQYADIVFWFQAAYAVGYLGFGRLIDKIGARFGFAVAIVIWTIAHVAHAAVRTVSGFTLVRVGLGLGEFGNFPAGVKAVAEWFPKSERALATSIFNAGSGIGAIVTPLIVPPIVIYFGWRAAFVITGTFSLVWLIFWLFTYTQPRQNKNVGPGELAFIESDPPDAEEHKNIPWTRLLRVKETWAYAHRQVPDRSDLVDVSVLAAGILRRPLSPRPQVLRAAGRGGLHHVGHRQRRRRLAVVAADQDGLQHQRGAQAHHAGVLLRDPAYRLRDVCRQYVAGGRRSSAIATAAHQSFSANLYTLPSDVFPRAAVGSVIGIGGTVGAIGGMLMSKYTGYVLDPLHTYTPIFIVAAAAYALALLVVHLLSPRYEPAKVN